MATKLLKSSMTRRHVQASEVPDSHAVDNRLFKEILYDVNVKNKNKTLQRLTNSISTHGLQYISTSLTGMLFIFLSPTQPIILIALLLLLLPLKLNSALKRFLKCQTWVILGFCIPLPPTSNLIMSVIKILPVIYCVPFPALTLEMTAIRSFFKNCSGSVLTTFISCPSRASERIFKRKKSQDTGQITILYFITRINSTKSDLLVVSWLVKVNLCHLFSGSSVIPLLFPYTFRRPMIEWYIRFWFLIYPFTDSLAPSDPYLKFPFRSIRYCCQFFLLRLSTVDSEIPHGLVISPTLPIIYQWSHSNSVSYLILYSWLSFIS